MVTHRVAAGPKLYSLCTPPQSWGSITLLCKVSAVLLYLIPKNKGLKAHGRPDTYHIWVTEAGPSLHMVSRVKGETIVSIAMGTQRCPSDPFSNGKGKEHDN